MGKSDAAKTLLVGVILGGSLLFFLSIGIGLWVAYDRWLALARFTMVAGGFICLGIGPWVLTKQQDHTLALLTASCSFVAGGLGLFFLLTHDWRIMFTGDFQPLPAVTAWVQWIRPQIGSTAWLLPLRLHENAVAGALIVLLPIGSISGQWRRQSLLHSLLEGSALLIAAFALLLTFSRGAWFGLGGGLTVTSLALYQGHGRRQRAWIFGCGALLMSIGVLLFVIEPRLLTALVQFGAWSADGKLASNRLTLWQDAVTLVGDYWFTGSGLRSTAMVLSSYVYLLHVPYLAHGHNFYLQLAIEQGAPALLAFVMVTGSILWCIAVQKSFVPSSHWMMWDKTFLGNYSGWQQAEYNASRNRVLLGATSALLALLIHGWFDAEFYVSNLVPLLFLPLGLLGAMVAPTLRTTAMNRWRGGMLVMGGVAPAVVILLIAGALGLPDQYLVNRAAVAQTRTELAIYEWPTWPLQDAVRQRFPAKFAVITAQYRAALRQNPANVAALRRLGQLLLSQEAYTTAQRHLEAAYRLAPDQRATRQLLGELYALAGDETGAHQLWQTIDLYQGQLTLRVEWYAQIGNFKNVLQLAKVVRTTIDIVE